MIVSWIISLGWKIISEYILNYTSCYIIKWHLEIAFRKLVGDIWGCHLDRFDKVIWSYIFKERKGERERGEERKEEKNEEFHYQSYKKKKTKRDNDKYYFPAFDSTISVFHKFYLKNKINNLLHITLHCKNIKILLIIVVRFERFNIEWMK